MVYIKQKLFKYKYDPASDIGTWGEGGEPLSNTNIFSLDNNGSVAKVSRVGIQGLPGTPFTFNGSEGVGSAATAAIDKATNFCSLGSTGIFELDLEGIGLLSSLIFGDVTSVYKTQCKKLGITEAKLVIDFLYEEVQ